MTDPTYRRQARGSECAVDGCDKPVASRGWCHAHYARWRKYRDPLGSTPRYMAPPAPPPDLRPVPIAHDAVASQQNAEGAYVRERFWNYVNQNGCISTAAPELGRCWEWTGSLTAQGYPRMWTGPAGRRAVNAHRISHDC